MLRITTVTHTPDRVVLKLEGWVSGTNVAFLEQDGTRCLQSGARLVLELSGVRFIDGNGLALLRRWSRSAPFGYPRKTVSHSEVTAL